MDSAKLKKLQDYSSFLTQQAEAKEARGEAAEAVKDYVKLVDVLLLLANDAKDHPTWQQLIGRAEEYQRKARALAAAPGAERGQQSATSSPPPPKAAAASILPYAGRSERLDQSPDSHVSSSSSTEVGGSTSSSPNRFRTLRKFPSLIGRKGEPAGAASGVGASSSSTAKAWSGEVVKRPTTTLQQGAGSELVLPPNVSAGGSQVSALALEGRADVVPYSTYAKLQEENEKLQREMGSLREKEKEYLEAIGSKDRMYAEAVATMVPKSEYDLLLAKLEDSVPRADYEQALMISAVPKERYIELQSQLTDLELRLANSVPRILVDEIAEYVSFLASTVLSGASPEEKEKKADGFLATAPKTKEEEEGNEGRTLGLLSA